jgi:hypothetical protein
MIASSVYGQFAISTIAPTSQTQWRVLHHASKPSTPPTIAKLDCITKPRL